MKRIAVALTLVLSSFNTWAYDGNDLYDWSKVYAENKVNNLWYGYYMGYVTATAHYMAALGGACAPPNTRDGQLFDIVHDYLKSHPATRTDDASVIIIKALQEAYPCKK